MQCDEFREHLDNYESLTDSEKHTLEDHAKECESCREELEFMLSVISVTKNLPEIKAPDDFIERLNERIDREDRKQIVGRYRTIKFEWKRYGSVAACLLLAAVVGVNGRNIVSDMTDTKGGVISESTVTADSVHNDVQTADNTVTAQTTDSTRETEADNATAHTPALAKENTMPEIKSSVPSVHNREFESNIAQRQTSGGANIKSSAENTPSAYNAPAVRTEQPSGGDVSDKTAAETAAPQQQAAVTETDSNAAEPYTLARERYSIPIESVPYGSSDPEQKTDNSANKSDGYAISEEKASIALGKYTPIDANGNSTDYQVDVQDVSDVPAGSSILVSSEDEEKVRSLMGRYITGNYGIYYMTTEDKLNKMFEEMDKAGINYEKFMSNSSERVSFKLVVVS